LPHMTLLADRRSVLDTLVSFGSNANLHQAARATTPPPPPLSSSAALTEQLLHTVGLPLADSFGDIAGLAPPLHPRVEALCDRVHSPVQGVRLRWTPGGKIVVWLGLFVYVGLLLVLQSLPIFAVQLLGVNGKVLQLPKDQYREFSFIGFFLLSNTISMDNSPLYGVLFFLFTALFPIGVSFLALLLWTIEMTIDQQKLIFGILELGAAWSCLDVFMVTIVGMRLELKTAIDQLGDFTVPNLAALVESILPFNALMSARLTLLPFGFTLFALTCAFEKFLLYFLMEQALVAISEREAELVLRSFAMDADYGLGDADTAPNSHIVEQAADGLLLHNASAMFSPAARYFSSYFPASIYSGLPRSWWTRFFVRAGLMADARTVKRFYETGSWPDGATTPLEF